MTTSRSGLKFVIVSPRFPYPLDRGDRLTVYHLCRFLSRRHEIALVAGLEHAEDRRYIEHLEPFCSEIHTIPITRLRGYPAALAGMVRGRPAQVAYYDQQAFRGLVRSVVSRLKPDVLYSHMIRVAPLLDGLGAPVRVLAMQLSMALQFRRAKEHSRGPYRWLCAYEERAAGAYEARIAREFDLCLLISKHDLRAIGSHELASRVLLNPHGVDADRFTPDPTVEREPNTIVMSGHMGYAPNIDGALYFAKEVLPLVRRQVPDVRWNVVGTDATPSLRALAADPRIVVTGRVPSVIDYLRRAQVAVAPIRMGAGLQNKLLEALSTGVPMVATTVANEGIGAEHDRDLLLADTPQAFATAVVRLLTDDSLRRRLATAGRAFIESQWTLEHHFSVLEQRVEELYRTSIVRGGSGRPLEALGVGTS